MIDALRTAGGVRVAILLLALVLALVPGPGLAQEDAVESGALVWMAGLIPWETMFGWVEGTEVAKALAFVILAVFFAVLAWLGAVWWQSARALQVFLKKIKSVAREPYAFAERYRDLMSDMHTKRMAGVMHAWKEFQESVFRGKDERGNILAYNTVPPDHFFVPDKLGMNFAAFRAMANYFVGVGLLLTFFGLAAALFVASGSITGGNGNQKALGALSRLLDAATLKFMTSIAGLLSSIALSIVILFASRHVSGLCASICEELGARVRFAVQEHFAVLQLQELQKQTATLEKFSTDLAISIAERIAAPFP